MCGDEQRAGSNFLKPLYVWASRHELLLLTVAAFTQQRPSAGI